MKTIITGSNGTVGSALKQQLLKHDWEVVGWNRSQIPIDDYHAMESFIRDQNPDVVFHLAVASTSTGRENEDWLVNYEWTSELAWITHILNIKFIFTSSVMVFTDDAIGPFTIESIPDAISGYGHVKLQAEQRVFYQNTDTIVARLGWQIGDTSGSNNMIDFFENQMVDHGVIHASIKWYPSCSFVPDTASALRQLSTFEGGLYLLNANPKWTFYEIACALNIKHGNKWKIEPTDDFVYDQRMIDDRVPITPLSYHLPILD